MTQYQTPGVWYLKKDVVSKCKEVWAIGGTDAEASFYAEISQKSLSRYLKAHKGVMELRDRLREKPVLKARRELVQGLEGNPELSLKYLERKKRDEFATKTESHTTGEQKFSVEISEVKRKK